MSVSFGIYGPLQLLSHQAELKSVWFQTKNCSEGTDVLSPLDYSYVSLG